MVIGFANYQAVWIRKSTQRALTQFRTWNQNYPRVAPLNGSMLSVMLQLHLSGAALVPKLYEK